MEFAAAASLHPVPADATGETVGQILERLGPYPDVTVVLLGPSVAGAAEDVAGAVSRLLSPTALLCAAVPRPIGPLEDTPAVSVWAARCGPAWLLRDVSGDPSFDPTAVLVLRDHNGLSSAPWPAGGEANVVPAAGLAGGVRVLPGGATGVAFGPGCDGEAFAAPGWRPIGPPLLVTRAEGSMVYELDGQPALSRLIRVARDEVAAGELPGRRPRFGLGDQAVWAFRGADRSNGALAIEHEPAFDDGELVHLWVDDPAVARAGLEDVFAEAPASALLFAHPEAERVAVEVGSALAAGGTAVCGASGEGVVGPLGLLGGGVAGLRFGRLL